MKMIFLQPLHRFAGIMLVVVTVSGCAGVFGPRRTARFDVSLREVRRTDGGTTTYSDEGIRTTGPPGENVHVFRDEIARFEWRLRGYGVKFSVTNRSEDRLRIDWNRARYQVAGHKPRKPILTGGRHDVDVRQPAMELPSGETRTDVFLPKGYVEYVEKYRKRRHRLLPVRQQTYESDEAFQRRARSWENANIEITLPVGHTNRTYTYSFDFEITSVRVTDEETGSGGSTRKNRRGG